MSITIKEEIGWYDGWIEARSNEWVLKFYRPGKDARHRGKFYNFGPSEVRALIKAYEDAFQRMEQLKQAIPESGSFTERHDLIYIHNIFTLWRIDIELSFGVVTNREELDRTISILRKCLLRGLFLVKKVNEISSE